MFYLASHQTPPKIMLSVFIQDTSTIWKNVPIIASAKAETQAEVNSSLTTWSITMKSSALQSQWSMKIHLPLLLQIIRLLNDCSVFSAPPQQTLHTMVSDLPGTRVPSVSCVWQHPESMFRHAGIWTSTLPHS